MFTFLTSLFRGSGFVALLMKTQSLCESYACVQDTVDGAASQGHKLWQNFYNNMPLNRWDGLDWGS